MAEINVNVSNEPIQQGTYSNPTPQYVRQQKGHSLILHILFGWILAYVPTIYFAVSPNHYFHA